MVALEWDQMGRDELVEQGRPWLHLYVGPEERPPSSAGSGPGLDGSRRERRPVPRRRAGRQWRFAVRRALVVVVIASLGALAWSVAEKLVAVASTGGGSAVGCTAGAGVCPGTRAYVAAPGDTIWSIAVRFSHGGDPRPLVERLEAEIDGSVLQPGQRLAVP